MDNKTAIIHENMYVILDIETTGFSVEHNNILEVAASKIYEGELIKKYHSFIKQREPIPKFIKNLTGISDNDVAGGKKISQVLDELILFIDDLPIVGHNISFDYGFINYNCQRHLGKCIENERIDTIRIAKGLIKDVENYRLDTLIAYFNINDMGHHRADNDVKMTYELIKCLSDLDEHYIEKYAGQINLSVKKASVFKDKKVAIKTSLKYVNDRLLEYILQKFGCKVWYALYPSTNILIVNDTTYKRLETEEVFDDMWQLWLNKAKERRKDGSIEIYTEKQICEILDIPVVEKKKGSSKGVSAKDIVPETDDFDKNHPLYNKYCVFTGVLDKYDRKTAMQYVVNVGGICQNTITKRTNYLILGDNSFCATIKHGKSTKQKKVEDMIEKGYDIQVIPESTFYQLLKNEEE